jgi:hypothetical protein
VMIVVNPSQPWKSLLLIIRRIILNHSDIWICIYSICIYFILFFIPCRLIHQVKWKKCKYPIILFSSNLIPVFFFWFISCIARTNILWIIFFLFLVIVVNAYITYNLRLLHIVRNSEWDLLLILSLSNNICSTKSYSIFPGRSRW